MTTREELAAQIDMAEWEWLRPHNERGALIVVKQVLDLAEVGEKMAADDSKAMQNWVAANFVAKPTQEQIATWEQEPALTFSVLIISPFVLIQEKLI
jgi:hypothetical protein